MNYRILGFMGLFLFTLACASSEKWMEGLVNVYGTKEHGWRPASGVALANPRARSEESIRKGRELYQTHCAPCHGDKGRGDGPLAAKVETKPRDFTQMPGDRSDYHIFLQTSLGDGSMPGIKSLSDDERWDIVNYLQLYLMKTTSVDAL